MIYFFRKLKSYKLKAISYKLNKGMTYIELIVVLIIFTIMSSVVIFNYGDFQSRIDLKNLASDIALQVVAAQKASLSGLQPVQIPTVSPWKPAYGIYFNSSGVNSKSFVYFVDLDNSNFASGGNCTGECVNYFAITKGNYVSRIDSYVGAVATSITNPICVTFKRPNSSAIFSYSDGTTVTGFDYMQITVSSPKGKTSLIKIYPSGRIQVN
ncbi:type II secretion system protein [Candidatus Nomurabacteria bacterium]|nr:type II secretion system protein [Candidatus Nomurabacteria bacterium]